jgi:short-subunit dehydrogenase
MSKKIKYTLITGGTTGIGFELARIFAKNGHNLIIVARDGEELLAAKSQLDEYGVSVLTMEKDLFNPEAPFELYEEISANEFDVNILVNNAGQGVYGDFADTDIWRELKIIQLNIGAVVVLTKAFLLEMLQKGRGRILNVSSVASKSPGPLQSVYHGTKAFVQSFTEAVREEVKDYGIVVTALLPGPTDTDFFSKANMEESKVVQEGKLADPAKVAEDGYKALMKDDDMVVSGLKNKIQVAMSNIMPDAAAARNIHKQQKPVSNEKKK